MATVGLRNGRRVVLVKGSSTQTINLCTSEGRAGSYEVTYRLPITEDVQATDLADLADPTELADWAASHNGIPELRDGRPGSRLFPLADGPVDQTWMTAAVTAVERVLDDVVTQFVEKPFLHRVEHSLHAEIYARLTAEAALAEQVALRAGQVTQLVHKEWPETHPDKSLGPSTRRGAFDLAVLAPDRLRSASVDQFRQGRVVPSIVIEVGLDYGRKHLEQDAKKLVNSEVEAPYLLHLSRIPAAEVADAGELVARVDERLRLAYVHVVGGPDAAVVHRPTTVAR